MLFNTSYTFLGDAVSGTALAGQSTNIDYKLDGKYMIFGAELLFTAACDGDYVSFQLVDIDNVLGYGAGLVLSTWVRKWFVPSKSDRWKVTSEMTGQLPSGVYARLVYTSTGSVDVPLKINYSLIEP